MKEIVLLTRDDVFINMFRRRMNPEKYVLYSFNDQQKVHAWLASHKSVELFILDVSIGNYNESMLDYIKQTYPNIIRMTLNDLRTTCENHMPAFEGIAQLNLNKTHSATEIWSLVDKVFDIDSKLKNRELMSLMSTLKNIPTIPNIYFELSHMIRNNASVEDIADKLESDPAISSNIIKMANTAFYNAKTGSIRQAIMFIGLINVKNIILTNAVFGNTGIDPKIRDIHWEHVRLTNKILNALYVELLGKKLNNNIASVGLLHDIGSVVMMANYPVEFKKIVEREQTTQTGHISMLEKEIVGFSHEELGGYLLDLWGFPVPVVEAALMHHDPLNPMVINRELVLAVHLANYFAWEVMDYDLYHKPINEDVVSALAISDDKLEQFVENLKTIV